MAGFFDNLVRIFNSFISCQVGAWLLAYSCAVLILVTLRRFLAWLVVSEVFVLLRGKIANLGMIRYCGEDFGLSYI